MSGRSADALIVTLSRGSVNAPVIPRGGILPGVEIARLPACRQEGGA
ncbi:MAG TPA: hypothetical protein PLU39_08350 [Armatimonadota bacterium]|nr:hypothetical protein [Armatimonadota bacterium]HPT97866.1 hypothetical protein [Armatimonadota bacterium]